MSSGLQPGSSASRSASKPARAGPRAAPRSSMSSGAGQIATTASTAPVATRAAVHRLEAAHARAAQRRPPARARASGRPSPARRRSRLGPNAPSERPWPRASKASAAMPRAARRAGEVEVALLGRAGAVAGSPRPRAAPPRAGTARRRGRRARPARRSGVGRGCVIIGRDHARRGQARPPSRTSIPLGSRLNERGPARGRRLRRARAGARVRHAGVRLRRGRHPRARARVHGRVPGAHRALRGDLREQGVPLHRGLPAARRGGAVVRRAPPAASCTWRSQGGFAPERIYMHGNNKTEAELELRGRARASGTSWSTRSTRSSGSSGSRPGRR